MAETTIRRRDIRSLAEFYALMAETRAVRVRIVEAVLGGTPVDPADFRSLEAALGMLGDVPVEGGKRVLGLGGDATIEVDLGYEVTELGKDLLFLSLGEEGFFAQLPQLHEGFEDEVAAGVEMLKGLSLNAFITDRDGTINNYCGRYRSSVQPAWNAVQLTRFARSGPEHPIIITSAPLADPGIVDVSVNPERALVYAASKGREFIDLEGKRRSYPISDEKQALVDRLNERLRAMVARPGFERFGLIGSGLQHKFGQTTIARQDITGSVPADESKAWLAELEALAAELDPSGERLVVEDTGLDVELILTVDEGGGEAQDFNKAAAVRFLASELGIELSRGPHLVCGDTASDVPMVDALAEHTQDTWAVFVTRKEDLAAKVRGACEHALIVSEPDVLVAILGELAKR